LRVVRKFASDRAYLGKERIKVCLIGDLDGGLGVAAEAPVDASPIGHASHRVQELNRRQKANLRPQLNSAAASNYRKCPNLLARPERFERPTLRFVV